MKRRLYVDGNTVYGIDEECLIHKRQNVAYGNRQDLDALWARYQKEGETEDDAIDSIDKRIES